MVSPFLPDEAKRRAVRDAIPAANAGIYVNTAAAGPLPAETAAAMAEIADHELRFGRAHLADLEDAEARRDEARAAVAAVVAGDVGSIALTRGPDEAASIAVRGVDWERGQRLVTVDGAGTQLEAGIRGLERRRGVLVTRLRVADDLDRLAADAVRDPAVRMVALPHVDAIGRVLPLADLAASLRQVRPDVSIVADGTYAVGSFPVVADRLGVDAYVIATDRWLLGPPGTGALWLADPLGGRLAPELTGPHAGASGTSRTPRAAGAGATGAATFEPGTLPVASAVGVARSCGWLSMYVGLDWLLSRPTALARELRDRLSTISGVTLLTPAGSASAVLALRIVGWEPDEAVAELGRRVFAIAGVTAEPPDGTAIRFSLAAFNDEAELERLAAAVELLAAHTPETLPRRTALTILPAP